MPLYLWLDLLAISIPFALSFEKNLQYYKKWTFLFSAMFLTMIPFLIWDFYFTQMGHWGFRADYLIGVELFSLPLEEILFFIVVPYASLFAYYAIRFHFPNYILTNRMASWLTVVLIVFALLLAAYNVHHIYTVINFSAFAFVIIMSFIAAREYLFSFYAIFPILLVPFFIMNGILTGTGIAGEIVWYSENTIMGYRILTIPIEDMFYAFTLLLSVLVLTEKLQQIRRKKR